MVEDGQKGNGRSFPPSSNPSSGDQIVGTPNITMVSYAFQATGPYLEDGPAMKAAIDWLHGQRACDAHVEATAAGYEPEPTQATHSVSRLVIRHR